MKKILPTLLLMCLAFQVEGAFGYSQSCLTQEYAANFENDDATYTDFTTCIGGEISIDGAINGFAGATIAGSGINTYEFDQGGSGILQRCLGGANADVACTNDSECPASTCAAPILTLSGGDGIKMDHDVGNELCSGTLSYRIFPSDAGGWKACDGGTGDVPSRITEAQDWDTSAEIVTNVTDETGTGSLVLAVSPVLTTNPTSPTQTVQDSDTSIASTAFVNAEIVADLAASPTITTPVLTLQNGASPVTTASRLYHDTTNKRVVVGNGTVAAPIGLFFPTVGIGYATFSTTKSYMPVFSTPGGNLSPFTTEATRQDLVISDIYCDAMSVCSDVVVGAGRAVVITLRTDTNADGTGADTAITCTVDGDGSGTACDGAATRKGCRYSGSPVLLAANSLAAYGAVAVGGTTAASHNFQTQLRCWPAQ